MENFFLLSPSDFWHGLFLLLPLKVASLKRDRWGQIFCRLINSFLGPARKRPERIDHDTRSIPPQKKSEKSARKGHCQDGVLLTPSYFSSGWFGRKYSAFTLQVSPKNVCVACEQTFLLLPVSFACCFLRRPFSFSHGKTCLFRRRRIYVFVPMPALSSNKQSSAALRKFPFSMVMDGWGCRKKESIHL